MDDVANEKTDIDDLIDQIPADALAECGLKDDAVEETPWKQNVGMALEEVVKQNPIVHQTGVMEIPPHVTELVKRGEDSKTHVTHMNHETQRERWSTSLVRSLTNAMGVMREIVGEMREHCHEYRSNSSWSSVSSGGSLCDQKNQSLILMLGILQDLYTEVTSSGLHLIQLMDSWFYEETDDYRIAYEGFQQALKLTTILREIIEFEVLMCDNGVGPVKVIPQENITVKKEKHLAITLRTMNDRVVYIQKNALHTSNLGSAGMSTVDRKKQAKMLRRCWESVKEVTCRVSSCHPTLKHNLYSHLLNTLLSAVCAMKNLQSTRENLDMLDQMRTALIDQEAPPTRLTDQEAEAQTWIFPCLKALRSFSNNVAKQICKSRSFKTVHDADPLLPLRSSFVELINISIARMIRLTQPLKLFDFDQITKRQDEGLKMLLLLSRYDECCLSTNSEESSDQYELFEKLTNLLLNNVLHYKTQLQANDISARHVIEHQVSLSSSGEIPALSDKERSGCIPHGQSWFSEDTTDSSRVGVGFGTCEDRQEKQLTSVSVDSSVVMPNPFKDAQPDSGVTVPDDFWGSEKSSEQQQQQQRHSNPLSKGGRAGLPQHQLSNLSEVYPCIRMQTGTCPGAEHFYTINKTELTVNKKLGSGSTGQVFRAFFQGVPVAMKVINCPELIHSKELLVHESEMHCRLAHHPNIVQFYGHCLDGNGENGMGLVMELCSIGSLFAVIRDARHVESLEAKGHDIEIYNKYSGCIFFKDWILRIKLACDIAAGMKFLQSRNVVHRDLTSYNVVLSPGGMGNQWIAKICDFERSRHVPPGTTIPRSDTTANSCAWASPEVLRNEDYSTQADVFSAGVILWEILTLEVPWVESRDPNCVIRSVSDGERLLIPPPNDTSIPEYPELVSLIEDAWKEDPNERPTMDEFHFRISQIWSKMIHRIRM